MSKAMTFSWDEFTGEHGESVFRFHKGSNIKDAVDYSLRVLFNDRAGHEKITIQYRGQQTTLSRIGINERGVSREAAARQLEVEMSKGFFQRLISRLG